MRLKMFRAARAPSQVTNEEIADALIEGIIRYAENPTIPKKEAVIQSWRANRIPIPTFIEFVGLFTTHHAGMTVPQEALPHCIAAVVTALHVPVTQCRATMRSCQNGCFRKRLRIQPW